MTEKYVYHAVTERPMKLGQVIQFDSEHHNGVWERITICKKIMANENVTGELADMIRNNLQDWAPTMYRELALEEIRQSEHPCAPSRLSCLYTSDSYQAAVDWARYFREIGRPVFSVVKLKVMGNIFVSDACNCFDGTEDETYNQTMARHYWNNDIHNDRPITEVLVDGKLTVIEVLENF